jgi:transglutaminase-like putative cysteine protease
MQFRVAHTTTYQYGEPVYLEPHLIRLRPRADPSQRVLRYRLRIHPRPAGVAEWVDAAGNIVTQAWFTDLVGRLSIESRFDLVTLRENPFDYLLPREEELWLPLVYPAEVSGMLAPYLGPTAVQAFAEDAARAAGRRAMQFLDVATRRIFDEFRHVERLEGAPYSAVDTLGFKEGSCRDLAVLLAEACRAVGFAARFVSGYDQASVNEERPAMHAWTEVYVPGGGWRGYDASRGVAVSAGHIAVAAGPSPGIATPITGGYRGAAGSRMEVTISMHSISSGSALPPLPKT